MLDQTENIENISNYFDDIGNNQIFMKEQLTDFSKAEKIKLNFTYCHICISKDGGLMAICKKKDFLDMQRGAVLNKYILVMFQDAIRRYLIPINWDYNKRYIVCLDFSQKNNLYGILNDGGILQFDYNECTHKEILTSGPLREGIIKAKFFEKGFIAFTNYENFYHVKDIKNPVALLVCSLSGLIKFSPNVDFVGIPYDYTSSQKNEFLITNQNGQDGIIQIIQDVEGQNVRFNVIDENYTEILGARLLLREKPQKLFLSNSFDEDENNDKDKKKGKKDKKDKKNKKKGKEEKSIPPPPKDNECLAEQPIIGKISAIAISASKKKIAFYNKDRKIAYLMNSDFSEKYIEINFNLDENEYPILENKEIYDVLNYEEGCQFLFCGEDTLALSRQRYIILSNIKFEKPFLYLIYEGGESDIKHGTMFSKCIPESDGIRYLTNEGVFLISQVPKELIDICNPFSESPSKKLIHIYKNTLLRKYNSDKDIRSLSEVLGDSIMNLQTASANIFWTETNNQEFRKEVQLFTLKAAQYAKKFVYKDEFNYEKFNEICKEMRIINNMRNDPTYPTFITYREYKYLTSKEIINRLIKYNNFQLAADVSKFLEEDITKVLHKYVISIMKKEIKMIEDNFSKVNAISKIEEDGDPNEIQNKYKRLFYHLEKVPGISYIKLAKKAAKLKGEKLARYLLEQEKSSLIKIPQLLELKDNKYEDAIHLAFQTYDFNAVIKVLHKIIKEGKLKMLASANFQKYFPKIILYLKKYNKNYLSDFLTYTKNNTALFYIKIDELLKTSTLVDRTNAIKECKTVLKKIDNDPNFDHKFAKKYLERSENSLEFKKICQDKEKAIIHYSEIRPYSVSIYDCYKSGFMKSKANFIEPQNKHFDYSHKKLNLLRLRSYLELKRPDAVDTLLEKTSLKKMGLTPMHLGEIYYDYKYYDKATEYLMQVKEPYYFSYVVDILKSMEKYKEALEIIISSKDNENKAIMVDEIIKKKPKLQKDVEELCAKYKVSLG